MAMEPRWQIVTERWPVSTSRDRVFARADAVEEVAHVVVAGVQPLGLAGSGSLINSVVARLDRPAADVDPAVFAFEERRRCAAAPAAGSPCSLPKKLSDVVVRQTCFRPSA